MVVLAVFIYINKIYLLIHLLICMYNNTFQKY